ncbi:uncharacterized protein B0H18DRAFT_1091569 [Fomitopsis serialis]|uniref:uncharacterized protein n=1 Tax=Fomitopsis serialis TaxID=139415 RepID=UPI00200851B5|nr:uncharacterized protein B0H18DRAFT_1091569 [Neoantrodia serialis]KAH9937357.1 hypothetical protein B0H18DRAFT_1091569 [Neoantrodia serialis]
MSTQPLSSTPPSSKPKRSSKMASSQSLTHLLNFTLPPRQSHHNQSLPRRTRRSNAHPAVWNKERFVNAQYRFVMNPHGDYTVHFADPDIFFQWQDILQVIVPRTSAIASAAGSGEQATQDEGVTTCPICLSPPTAPRMTKCGHVFCFPCILHYLNTADNTKWVRCPICFDSVHERQLKAVKWFDEVPPVDDTEEPSAQASSSSSSADDGLVTTPRPGSTLRMRLIQRPQITTLALPRSETWPSDLLPPHQAPFHFLPDVLPFAKFMLATPAYLIQDLTKDLDDLATERRMLSSMGDELGVAFVDAAEAKLRVQIAKASALETTQLQEAVDSALHVQQQIRDRTNLHDRRRRDEQARVPRPEPEEIPQELLASQNGGLIQPNMPKAMTHAIPSSPSVRSATPTRGPRQRRNLNPPPPSTSTYYYYQAATGMPVFLHPLDIRILFSHFNGYAAFPDTISVRVESYAESTVNDDLRKRCKYLGHLPEGADVVFVEADLEDVVGAEGLKNFEGPLRMRPRAEERERERLAQAWRPRLMGRPASLVQPSSTGRRGRRRLAELLVQQPAGAWGARSSHLPRRAGRRDSELPARSERNAEEDEWDLDVAFHELEQRGSRGGGRKRSAKMVVLGGGGGGGGDIADI